MDVDWTATSYERKIPESCPEKWGTNEKPWLFNIKSHSVSTEQDGLPLKYLLSVFKGAPL